MMWRTLTIWVILALSSSVFAQYGASWSLTLDQVFPEYIRSADIPRTIILTRQADETSFGISSTVDSTHPYQTTFQTIYRTPSGDSVEVVAILNPNRETISFDVTKDFEVFDIEGARHGIRGSQQLVQKSGDNTYTGPFTTLFLGSFTMPYIMRYPEREGHWAPDQFITATTYPAYDVSKSYLDVQCIYITISGEPELAQKIIDQLKLDILNKLIAEK